MISIEGIDVKKVITAETPADEAMAAMNDFMKYEEKLNGDPIREFPHGVRTHGIAVKAATAAGAAETARMCSKYPQSPKQQRFPAAEDAGLVNSQM